MTLTAGRPTSTTTPISASRAAAQDLLAMLPSVVPFGAALGVTAGSLGVGGPSAVLGAGLVYAGTAQLTAMTLMSTGTVASVVLSGLLVNSRLLLYGAGLEPRFRRQTLAFRLLAAHFVIDQTYLAASGRRDLDDDTFRRYWLRIGIGLLVAWTSAVALGVALRPVLPDLPHLGLVPFALFAAMLAGRLHGRPAVGAALAAAGVVVVATAAVPSVAVPVGALAGVTAGTVVQRLVAGRSS
jgi:predicted branched-subunit amino acid permease